MSTIFVCGATGTQGGAITTHLLKSNIKVHTIARDASSKRSQALQAAGGTVTLFPGDFDNEASLRTAMHGCTGLFLNLMPSLTDSTQELNQANRILAVAKAAGIEHVVYSSGLVQEPERRKYWDPNSFVSKILLSKNAVEDAVRSAGFKYYTILRPGNFMTNYLSPFIERTYPGLTGQGESTTALTRETIIPMVDPDDIGKFGVAAFLDPGRFHGKEVGLASEMLGVEDIMKALSRATGRALKMKYLSQEEIDSQLGSNPFLGAQLMSRDMDEYVDMEEVRSWGIPLGTFDGFLEREKERVAETY